MRNLTVWILAISSLTYCFGGTGEDKRHVWLAEGGSIVQYDPSTWSVVREIVLPEGMPERSDGLQIVSSGAMLFLPDSHSGCRYPGSGAGGSAAWIWNGEKSSSLQAGCQCDVASAVECRESVREICPRIAMSYDGRKLFWFANESETVREVDGPDISVSATFHAWQTDLDGSGRIPVAESSFPPCVCATGACSETCPEGDVWFPPEGIDDFFIVRHFIEGQLGSTPVDSFIYRHEGGKWSSSKFVQDFDAVLDAGAGGDAVIYAIRDSGCCGWDNDSDDRTLLSSGGKTRVIFDERERFSNPDYDVSFYTSKALLSPDASHIALNIGTTQRQGDQVRLSSSGKEDPDELAGIREAMKSMPAVEVIDASAPDSPVLSLPKASLVGWLNRNEVLVVRAGILVRCDVAAGVCGNTPVSVQKGGTVFIR